jgi:hypothetical protein
MVEVSAKLTLIFRVRHSVQAVLVPMRFSLCNEESCNGLCPSLDDVACSPKAGSNRRSRDDM